MNNNSNITNPLYQSTFLPLFSRAETEIKKEITNAYLLKTSRFLLMMRIQAIITLLDKKIPADLENREEYFNGLKDKSQLWVKKYYDKPLLVFMGATAYIYSTLLSQKKKIVKLDTPLELIKASETNRDIINLYAEAKGHVRIPNYAEEIKRYINDFSKQTLTTSGEQRPISLWQKAELDIRHQKQLDMLQEFKDKNIELAYISSHPDCSERCERWQGKLVSLTEHAKMSGMRVRKAKNGEWIYSLTDIMAQTDKYGYHNNIISGFNCRHYLIPYTENAPKPNIYDERDVAKEREINSNLRKMEREIRETKARAILYSKASPLMSKKLKRQAELMTKKYKDYANKNGFAWFEYRLKV